MARMIFHTAYRLNPNSVSASAIRPIRMLHSFHEAGYDVFNLTGTSTERRKKFAALKQLLREGVSFDFLYSESATIPPMVGDPSHFPHFFLDFDIFRTIHAHDIPMSVFYRDIYWVFDEYAERVGLPVATAMRQLYRAELALYNRYMDTVYVPSREMGTYLSQLTRPAIAPLPPGGDIIDTPLPHEGLEIFYIGGIGAHYDMHALFEAVAQVPQVHLTVCTARERWETEKDSYPLAPNITVAHKSGTDRDSLYGRADICSIVVAPQHYWGFAAPVKLYEYIGRGKPIIASTGTLAGQFVADHGIGWTIDNSPREIARLLSHLADHPDEIEAARAQVRSLRTDHTWKARATQVAQDAARR